MNINNYKNKKCLTTPEDYFEKLNLEIREATCNSKVAESKKKSVARYITNFMSYAAMIAIVATVAISIIFNNNKNSNTENLSITNIEEFEESDFIENMLTNYPIDEYTFYCYLTGHE